MHPKFIWARVFRGFSLKLVVMALWALGLIAEGGTSMGAGASVKITQPFDGQEFLPGETVRISAEAVNPNGNVYAMAIFDGTNLIHKVDRTLDANQTQPMKIQFSWGAPFVSAAPLGAHTITVRAEDGPATVATSEPVHILVDPAARPWVSVRHSDFYPGPTPYADYSRGPFVIDRVHKINEPLMIFLRFSGTATAGEDYLALPDHVLFPAGKSQVIIWPEAVDDNIVEGDETLILEVVPPPPGTETEFPTTYVFGPPASGTISDNESTNFPPHLEIVKPQYQQLLEQGSDIEFK